ncbi:hypothetical protein ACWD5F_11790 [Streptomyces sp. NPDC002499]
MVTGKWTGPGRGVGLAAVPSAAELFRAGTPADAVALAQQHPTALAVTEP